MNPIKKILLAVALILLVILSWSFFFWQEVRTKPLPVFDTAFRFSLYDSNGKEFTSKDLRNKICVFDFIFTTCAGICPMMSQHMSKVYNAYLASPDVHFVSISVNPEYDSPQVLAGYAKRYNADTTRWHFLTGARDEISNLTVNGFKIGSIEQPIMHSGYFVLVDKKWRIRGYYDGSKATEVEKLSKDIALLLKEK